MPNAKVIAIHIAPAKAAPMQAVNEARAVPGQGLEGDRYFNRQGSFSRWLKPGRELTLIEEEAVEAFNREHHTHMQAGESRRNITVCGLRLNDLIGRTFRIGEVELRATERAEPCGHLARLTGKPVREGLAGRCGIRAEILSEGMIRVGDTVVVERKAAVAIPQ